MIKILKIRTEDGFGSWLDCAPQTYSLFKEESGRYFFQHWMLCEDEKRRSQRYDVRAEDIEPLLKKLNQLNIPAFPVHESGEDGESTELEIESFGGKSAFRWWSVPPAGWEEVDEIVKNMLNLILK